MKKISFFLFLPIFFLLAGCWDQPNSREELMKLQAEVDNLQAKLSKMENTVNYLKVVDALSISQANIAIFTPGSTAQTYMPINTEAGKFLVSLDSISKYVDGYKIQLSVGNVNYAIYTDLKVKIKYGKGGIMESEISLNHPLRPGTWNKVSIILSPATAKDISSIAVSLETVHVILLPTDEVSG